MKILIFRLSSMGDIVWTTPVIRCIKKQLKAEVHFICKKDFEPILSSNPYIDQLWAWDKITQSYKEFLQENIKPQNYDLVIDLHNNLRSRILARTLNIKSNIFDKLRIKKWLAVHLKWNMLPEKHIVDRYLDTCKSLGIVNDFDGMDFFIHPDNEVSIENWGLKPLRYAVIAVGAAHYTKQVPNSQLIPLMNHLNIPLVLIGGKDVSEKAKAIENKYCGELINLVGELNIQQSASVIEQSGLLMAPDTGMMHVGAALKKPIVVFWGNTIEDFGIWPYYGKHKVPYYGVEVRGLKCRPCDKIGKKKCPKGHFKCMKFWNPMEIAENIDLFWKEDCYHYNKLNNISKI